MKLAPLLLFTSALFSSICSANHQIIDGQFHTDEGFVPTGCVAQLMTELNGDNIVAAVYLNRPGMRGCIAANSPYPNDDPASSNIRYEIIGQVGPDQYKVQVCRELPGGSMGANCDRILVEFKQRPYQTHGESQTVLSLEKIGQW